ncbi:MAG: C40 family peptidase [Thermoleophilia bacterium]|nr:C40 family peptidase [Thermoleophilia bacterium]
MNRSHAARVALAATLAALPTIATTPASADASPRRVTTTIKERTNAVRVALRKVGAPYRWGATGPSSFDCSGLVVYSYQRAGHALRGRTSQQLYAHGVRIRRSKLRRGDLVYTWDRGRGHVGMYVGRGRYVHAPGAGRHVKVAPLPGGRAFVGAVRP